MTDFDNTSCNLRNTAYTFRMEQGTIKKIIFDKGFGFIANDGGDLFFHRSAIEGNFDDLFEGQKVEYTKGQGPKGPCAENVKPV